MQEPSASSESSVCAASDSSDSGASSDLLFALPASDNLQPEMSRPSSLLRSLLPATLVIREGAVECCSMMSSIVCSLGKRRKRRRSVAPAVEPKMFRFQRVVFPQVTKSDMIRKVTASLWIYPATIVNIVVMLRHGHVLPAVAVALATGRTIFRKAQFVPWHLLVPVTKSSVSVGFVEPWLVYWLALDRTMLSSLTLLLSCCAHLNSPDLTLMGAGSALATMVLGIHGMATENVATHIGDTSRQFAKALLTEKELVSSAKVLFFTSWSYIHMTSEVALTMVASKFVPLWLVLASFLPSLFTKYVERSMALTGPMTLWICIELIEDPFNLMTISWSFFGMPVVVPPLLGRSGQRKAEYSVLLRQMDPRLECAAMAARYTMLSTLLVHYQGAIVLVQKALAPKLMHLVEEHASSALEWLMLAVLLLTLPLNVAMMMCSLVMNRNWGEARNDADFQSLTATTMDFFTRYVPSVRKATRKQLSSNQQGSVPLLMQAEA